MTERVRPRTSKPPRFIFCRVKFHFSRFICLFERYSDKDTGRDMFLSPIHTANGYKGQSWAMPKPRAPSGSLKWVVSATFHCLPRRALDGSRIFEPALIWNALAQSIVPWCCHTSSNMTIASEQRSAWALDILIYCKNRHVTLLFVLCVKVIRQFIWNEIGMWYWEKNHEYIRCQMICFNSSSITNDNNKTFIKCVILPRYWS